MNCKSKGVITEIETMLAFVKLGIPVLIPYGDKERYDYAIDIKGRFIRIQSKTAHAINEGRGFAFEVRANHAGRGGKTQHHIYTPDEVDYFATAYNGQCYLVPVGLYLSAVKLRLSRSKNGQDYRGAWAKDYELEKIVNTW